MAQLFLTSIDLNGNELQNVVLQVLAADPVTNVSEGRIYANSTTNKLRVYNGAAWRDLYASITDNANGTFSFVGSDGATVAFDAAQATKVAVTDGSTVDLTLTGNGSTASPYTLTAESILDPAAGNLLSSSVAGLKASIVTDSTLTGAGTTGSPLAVAAIALTSVTVYADIATRDADTVQEGDVAVVTDSDGSGNPETYIYDGSAWVAVVGSEVVSVAGKAGVVTLATDDLTDVDTTTVAPVVNDFMKFNGTSWVPSGAVAISYRQTGVVLGTAAGVVTITHSLALKPVNVTVINASTGAVVGVDVIQTTTNAITLEANGSAVTVDVLVTG